MKVKFYWTRGSTPISNPNSIIYWWNTTNLRVYSDCLPKDTLLSVDAGTWFMPMSIDWIKEWWKTKVTVLFTHYHHDHTQWLLLSPYLFNKSIDLKLFWPIDSWVWPQKMIQTLVIPPYFPVHYKEIESHIIYEWFDFLQTVILVFHPDWWQKTITKKEYEMVEKNKEQIKFWKKSFDLNECLVIHMHKSNHPEHTVSYRFEEKTTWKVFVFMTDHENQDWLPNSLRNYLTWADLLVMDSQYTKEKYEKATSWFWHWTPDYCAKIAKEVWIKNLWLTHHDPLSTDIDVENIAKSAIEYADDKSMNIFAVRDYQEIEI